MKTRAMEVLWIARYDYHPKWTLKEHDHPYYQMIYVLSGKGIFYLGGEAYPISGEMLFSLKPGVKHGLVAAEDETVKTLDIKFQIKNKEWEKLLTTQSQIISPCTPEVKNLLERIREEGMKKKFLYKEFSLLYLEQILLHVLRIEGEKNSVRTEETGDILDICQDPVCAKVLEYYRTHYDKELTLKDMAAYLGYNQSYICQNFKKFFNCTPIQYLYRYRIRRARELIIYSDFSLKQIADMTGFKSIHHFTRVFKELEGITPGQFREQEKEGIRKDIYLNDTFQNQNYTQKTSEP